MNSITPIPSRDSLRARIEAAEHRNATRTLADQASEAAAAATDYARANPLKVVAGALAVGLLIGIATRSGRKVAGRTVGVVSAAASGAAESAASGIKHVAVRGGSRMATLLGEAALAYAMTLINDIVAGARSSQEKIVDLGEGAGAAARKTSAKAADAVRKAARKVAG